MNGQPITIVSGLPRSGTSLMMQMIESGGLPVLTDGVRESDVDNPRGYYELEAAKRTRQDPAWVERAPGHVVKVIHALLEHLPTDRQYRVVFMHRDLREVIRSQAKMLRRLGTQGADLPSDKLQAAFERQLERVRGYLADQPGFDVHYVVYHELVADPAPAAAAVNRFLGGELDEAAMAACVDPSLYRHRVAAKEG